MHEAAYGWWRAVTGISRAISPYDAGRRLPSARSRSRWSRPSEKKRKERRGDEWKGEERKSGGVGEGGEEEKREGGRGASGAPIKKGSRGCGTLGSGARSAGKPGAGSCQGKALLATAKARDPSKLQARLQGSTWPSPVRIPRFASLSASPLFSNFLSTER